VSGGANGKVQMANGKGAITQLPITQSPASQFTIIHPKILPPRTFVPSKLREGGVKTGKNNTFFWSSWSS
jgi:hypothetical protein